MLEPIGDVPHTATHTERTTPPATQQVRAETAHEQEGDHTTTSDTQTANGTYNGKATGTEAPVAEDGGDANAEIAEAALRAERVKAIKTRMYEGYGTKPVKQMTKDEKLDAIDTVTKNGDDLKREAFTNKRAVNRLIDILHDAAPEEKAKLQAKLEILKAEGRDIQDELDAIVERSKDLGIKQSFCSRLASSGAFQVVTGLGGLITGLIFVPQAFQGLGGSKKSPPQDPSAPDPSQYTQAPPPQVMQYSAPPPVMSPQPVVYNPYPSSVPISAYG